MLIPALTTDERDCLTHWMMWGATGYPVRKLGSRWIVEGYRGLGRFSVVFKTKREAVARWELYMELLKDKSAGRL